MGIKDGIGCFCLIGFEIEFFGYFDFFVIDQLSMDGNGCLFWIKWVLVFYIKLIRIYKFDVIEVIECECYIVICRLYIFFGIFNLIIEFL